MQGPPTSPTCAVTVQSSIPSMQISIQLIVPLHTMKAVNTHALVDSGANISCIDWDFVKKHQLPTTKLKLPSEPRMLIIPTTRRETSCTPAPSFSMLKALL